MKNMKFSSYILLFVLVFFIVLFAGYHTVRNNIVTTQNKDTQILFYEIQILTADLLSKLLHEYAHQKDPLLEKHRTVAAYLAQHHPLTVNLDEIYQKINEGEIRKPYNIYIANKELVIQNTTYPNDLGFDLNFAKAIFEQHKAEGIIGCSAPIREKGRGNFLSYTDAYLGYDGDDRGALLQVSYTYNDTSREIDALQRVIDKYPSVMDLKAYGIDQDGQLYSISLYQTKHSFDPDLSAFDNAGQDTIRRLEELENYTLFKEDLSKDGTPYIKMLMPTESNIHKDMKIVYSLLLDESAFKKQLNHLDLLMLLISILGAVTFFTIIKVRDKEVKLSEHDQFIQSAMHEIKTPLSVITLNNELRQLEYGTDDYSQEIDNALKLLHTSYSTMSFIVTKEKLAFEKEIINLAQIVEERIAFFRSIAANNEKKIVPDISDHCLVEISLVELTRLIDNNLSNAIKFSEAASIITVTLKNGRLSFHNYGKEIKNHTMVFRKYFRENKTVGGYGLGLSIIREICQKYSVEMDLHSDSKRGTTFTYRFKCHTDDTSKKYNNV